MQKTDLTEKTGILQSKKIIFFESLCKNGKKTITKFGDTEIEKQKFH